MAPNVNNWDLGTCRKIKNKTFTFETTNQKYYSILMM
jgi:hypothetical protein